MNLHVRSLAATLAVGLVAVAYFVFAPRMERPGPRRPAPPLSAPRPASLPSAPPTAREILGQAVTLDLGGEQIVRLKALDQLWAGEVSGLQARVDEAEREFSIFASEPRGTKRVSLPEIQRRSAEFGQLSAELRERRQHHSDAALGVLTDWQRQRLAGSRRPFVEGRSHEGRRH